MQIVEVDWVDAQSSLDCWELEDLRKMSKKDLSISKSCGYLVHKDKDKVILAFMRFGDDLIKHHQVIPTGMVVKIKEIR